MTAKNQASIEIRMFPVIIGCGLLVQLAGRYHAHSLVIGSSFYLSWVLLRIVFPVIMLFIMKIPVSSIGLGMPRTNAKTLKIIIGIVALLVMAFTGIYFLKGYFASYAGAFAAAGGWDKFIEFMIFTGSTLTGWEFLHRGFLLFGIRYALVEQERLTDATASIISIGIVWIFEVLFHFIKPELESLGMLVGSPVLSWLALRTGSIWIAFLIHLLVEVLFITTLILQ